MTLSQKSRLLPRCLLFLALLRGLRPRGRVSGWDPPTSAPFAVLAPGVGAGEGAGGERRPKSAAAGGSGRGPRGGLRRAGARIEYLEEVCLRVFSPRHLPGGSRGGGGVRTSPPPPRVLRGPYPWRRTINVQRPGLNTPPARRTTRPRPVQTPSGLPKVLRTPRGFKSPGTTLLSDLALVGIVQGYIYFIFALLCVPIPLPL